MSPITDKLTEEITATFPQKSQDLVNAFSIFSLRGVFFMTTEDLSNYGSNKLRLLDHYESNKTKDVGGKVALIRWNGLCLRMLLRSSITQLISYAHSGVVLSTFIQRLSQIY